MHKERESEIDTRTDETKMHVDVDSTWGLLCQPRLKFAEAESLELRVYHP